MNSNDLFFVGQIYALDVGWSPELEFVLLSMNKYVGYQSWTSVELDVFLRSVFVI